jgi:hypothetical protein
MSFSLAQLHVAQVIMGIYPLVNKQLDPENHHFLMETSLPTPMTARVYVNLLEGIAGGLSTQISLGI